MSSEAPVPAPAPAPAPAPVPDESSPAATHEPSADEMVARMMERRSQFMSSMRACDDPPAESFEKWGEITVAYSPRARNTLSIALISQIRVQIPRMRALRGPGGQGTRFVVYQYRALCSPEEEALRHPFIRQIMNLEDVAPDHVQDYLLALEDVAQQEKVVRDLALEVPRSGDTGAGFVPFSRAIMNICDLQFGREQPMQAAIEVMDRLVPYIMPYVTTFRATPPTSADRLLVAALAFPALLTPPLDTPEATMTMLGQVCQMGLQQLLYTLKVSADVRARIQKKLTKGAARPAAFVSRYLRLA